MEPTTLEQPTTSTAQDAPKDLPADFDIMKWAQQQDDAETKDQAAKDQAAKDQGTRDQGTKNQGTADQGTTKPEDGQTKPADAPASEQAAGTQTPDAGKSETPEAKAARETERRDRSWKALDQEKQEFRQHKAAFDAELAGLRRENAQLRVRLSPAKDEHGVTADGYDRIAKQYEEEGNDQMATLARERAEKLRRQGPAAIGNDDAWQSPQFQEAWKQNTDQLIAEDGTLADPNNPVVKAANTLIQDKTWGPIIRSRPDGIRAAVEVARVLQKAHQAAALQESLKKAEAEIQRLTKLTQPQGSRPSAPPRGSKRIEDMNAEEAHAEILRIASAADRGEAV